MKLISSCGLRVPAFLLVFLLAAFAPAYAVHVHRGPTAPSHHKSKKSSVKRGLKGQRQIDTERATQIQEALIKAGYMSGAPSGQMDSRTTAALQKLQGDNGWQTKITPDSRALIKLGLGPKDTTAAASSPASSAQQQRGESVQADSGMSNTLQAN
ncbi:MAG: peptidoglycan-binding domain-containing protein [Acidobacteriaceae bacterium]